MAGHPELERGQDQDEPKTQEAAAPHHSTCDAVSVHARNVARQRGRGLIDKKTEPD